MPVSVPSNRRKALCAVLPGLWSVSQENSHINVENRGKMNIEAIKADLQALCEKHKFMMYADEENPCTVIEGLLSMEEAEGGCTPERFRFEFITSEKVNEY